MTRDESRFADEVGVWFQGFGVPRMAGRILGWLLICDPPVQSSAQLAEALSASKGSISTGTRLLERYGMIERLVEPGERGDRFRVAPDTNDRMVERRLAELRRWRELAQRGLDTLGEEGAGPRGDRLRETRDLYAYLEQEYPQMLARFEARRRDGRDG